MTENPNLINLDNNKRLISFSDRFLGSSAFAELFDNGMALVEQSAKYLDTTGRDQSKLMDHPQSLAYATESMRLTTRLMQLASWLLLQRAVSEGEMTMDQAREEQQKVKIKKYTMKTADNNWEMLPEELRDLIEQSVGLQEKIMHFDQALSATQEGPVQQKHPLEAHLSLLNDAFCK